jgi:hypothetical protein
MSTLAGRGLQPNAIKLRKNIYHVGWVERSETHRTYLMALGLQPRPKRLFVRDGVCNPRGVRT